MMWEGITWIIQITIRLNENGVDALDIHLFFLGTKGGCGYEPSASYSFRTIVHSSNFNNDKRREHTFIILLFEFNEENPIERGMKSKRISTKSYECSEMRMCDIYWRRASGRVLSKKQYMYKLDESF